MSGKIYGYVRVSTRNQREDRQLVALREYGVASWRIVVEKQSGKDFNRPGYRRLLRRLHAGDTLVIASLDRLGRNYAEIQEQWRIISKERGVASVVLAMPLLTTNENAELGGPLSTDLGLQLLRVVAQTERESIRARQREGIEAAKARGVRFGRPRLAMPEGFADVVAQWRRGEFTALEAARKLGVSRSTFFRRVRELERMRREAGQTSSKKAVAYHVAHYPMRRCELRGIPDVMPLCRTIDPSMGVPIGPPVPGGSDEVPSLL